MWIELIAFLAAPAIGILMDKVYFESMIHIVNGFLTRKKQYEWHDFINSRLIGISISSLGIAYAIIEKNIVIGMISAIIFLSFHFVIYRSIYLREKREHKN